MFNTVVLLPNIVDQLFELLLDIQNAPGLNLCLNIGYPESFHDFSQTLQVGARILP